MFSVFQSTVLFMVGVSSSSVLGCPWGCFPMFYYPSFLPTHVPDLCQCLACCPSGTTKVLGPGFQNEASSRRQQSAAHQAMAATRHPMLPGQDQACSFLTRLYLLDYRIGKRVENSASAPTPSAFGLLAKTSI